LERFCGRVNISTNTEGTARTVLAGAALYSTDVFMSMMGDLSTGCAITYTGRVLPIVHTSEDGHDGSVRIEFYGKPAANPLVRLSWTDAQGNPVNRTRPPRAHRRNAAALGPGA